MSKMNPQVDGYIRKNKQWQDELNALRKIILGFPLTEEVKWRNPCYTLDKKLVLFLGCFKASTVLSFAKGALLKDPKHVLIQQTENSQAVRIIRFADVGEIKKMEPTLRAYIQEAIDVEKTGLKVRLKTTAEFKVPEEFQAKLKALPALKKAYDGLTPGRQRGYLLYFSGAKQSKTREARVEKYVPKILSGKGLDDD